MRAQTLKQVRIAKVQVGLSRAWVSACTSACVCACDTGVSVKVVGICGMKNRIAIESR